MRSSQQQQLAAKGQFLNAWNNLQAAKKADTLPPILLSVITPFQVKILCIASRWHQAELTRIFTNVAYRDWQRQLRKAKLNSPIAIANAIAALKQLDSVK
jgi:hypothetical protein